MLKIYTENVALGQSIRALVTLLKRSPTAATARRVIGHWEADTVLGKLGDDCLVTCVDRLFLLVAKAARKMAQTVTGKLIGLLGTLPEDQRQSVTPDRVKESAWYARITDKLGILFNFPALTRPGSAAATKIQTACCGSISRRGTT